MLYSLPYKITNFDSEKIKNSSVIKIIFLLCKKIRSLNNFKLNFVFQVWGCIKQNLSKYVYFVFLFCVWKGVVVNAIIGNFSDTILLST